MAAGLSLEQMEPRLMNPNLRLCQIPSEHLVRYAAASFAALAFRKIGYQFRLAAWEKFRFGAAYLAAPVAAFCFAWNSLQRFFCAAAIRFLAAHDSRRFGPEPSDTAGATTGIFAPPRKCFRIAVTFSSIFRSSAV